MCWNLGRINSRSSNVMGSRGVEKEAEYSWEGVELENAWSCFFNQYHPLQITYTFSHSIYLHGPIKYV